MEKKTTQIVLCVRTVQDFEIAKALQTDVLQLEIDAENTPEIVQQIRKKNLDIKIMVLAGPRTFMDGFSEWQQRCPDYWGIIFDKDQPFDKAFTLDDVFSSIETVACVSIEGGVDPSLILNLKDAGFKGVCFTTHSPHHRILDHLGIEELSFLIEKSRENQLLSGLSGKIEMPDIPRYLAYHPDFLSFEAFKSIEKHNLSNSLTAVLRHALVEVSCDGQEKISKKIVTDRMIVRDLILPIAIGVYDHEYKKKQKVCFNVIAEVERIIDYPEDMQHIFSYDLIIDSIKHISSSGHIQFVETLAERIAADILHYQCVRHVMVRVEKLELGPAAVGVEIKRFKN